MGPTLLKRSLIVMPVMMALHGNDDNVFKYNVFNILIGILNKNLLVLQYVCVYKHEQTHTDKNEATSDLSLTITG